jgi:hypothetical protein
MPLLLLAVQVLAVGFVSLRLSRRFVGSDASHSEDWLTGLVLALAQVVLVAQVLGVLGLLSRGWLVGVHVLLAVAVAVVVPPREPRKRVRPTPQGIVTAVVCGSTGCLALALGLKGRSLESDTIEYHAANAGFWATSHSLWEPPFAAPGYLWSGYPSNLELSAAWLIAPIGSDQGVYALNVVWGALLVLGVAVLARELGAPLWVGALAGATLALTPLVFWTQVHSLMTDVAASAGIVACLAITLAARRPGAAELWWVPAGLALGLSVGSKYTAAVPAVAVLLAVALLAPAGATLAERAARCARVGGLALLLVAVWLARNWVQLENPLYPVELALGDRVLFSGADSVLEERFGTSMLHHVLQAEGGPLRTWWSNARLLLGPTLLVCGVGLVAGVWARGRPGEAYPRRVVAGVAVVAFLSYLVTPYTGGGADGVEFLIASQLRYALVALALAVALLAAATPSLVAVLLLGPTLAWALTRVADGPGFRPDLQVSAGVVVVAGAVVALAGVAWAVWAGLLDDRVGRRPRVAVAAACVGVAALVTLAWAQRHPSEIPDDVDAVVQAAREDGPVLVVSAHDVRALVGDRLDGRLAKVSAGGVADERVILDADELTARIEAARPGLVVVGGGAGLLIPDGWQPPSTWTLVGKHGVDAYYVLP